MRQQIKQFKMQNIQKRKKQYFKNFLYKRVDSSLSLSPLYVLIVILNIIVDAVPLYEYSTQITKQYISIGSNVLLYIQISLLGVFLIITFVSTFNSFVSSIWIYYVLFLQALTSLYVRTLGTCMGKPSTDLCTNQLSMKIIHIVVMAIFSIIIIVFKNFTYYPFQNVSNLFSMRQENISVYLLIFRIFLGLVAYHDIFDTRETQIKAIIISAFLIFWKSRNSGYNHQLSKRVWDIYYYFIGWTCLSLFVGYYLSLIQSAADTSNTTPSLNFQHRFLIFWGYTFPFVLIIPIFNDLSSMKSQYWKNIFETDDHELAKVHGRQNVFIICSQFHKKIEQIRKSQMKYRDPQFKQLCVYVQKHMNKCLYQSCPLHQLHQLKIDSPDQFLQHKRFLKTINCSVQYTRIILQKLKQIQPHNLQINIQIAHFYLLALKNKQKGMSLYNQIHTKKTKVKQKETQFQDQNNNKNGQEQQNKKTKQVTMEQKTKPTSQLISFSNKYAVYYLKKKIDNVFVGQQKPSQSNVDNQISQFRQKIEVSVTMLAQFWSLLADPKCNLKKLYDLANILFPLKVSLQKDWQKVKLFKNIECYNLYAKYLIKMFNDKQKGIKILQQAKKIDYEIRNKQQIELDDKGGQIQQQSGIIFMQFDGKNSGVMFQVNVNGQKIFGYSKGELRNKKVNDIMPGIYAIQHDKVLQNYQQTNYSTMMNKQRQVWGKSKNGFLFPFTILIKPILSFYSQSSSSEVYASIKKQTHIRQLIGIILDVNQMVQEFSSSALRVFPVLVEKYKMRTSGKNMFMRDRKKDGSDKKITQFDFNIRQIIPDYDIIKQKILNQNEQLQLTITRQVKTGKNNPQLFKQQGIYSIQINQIVIKTAGKIGYIIKLTKMGSSNYELDEREPQKPNLMPKQNKYQNDFIKSAMNVGKQDQLNGDKKNKGQINKEKENKVKFNLDTNIDFIDDKRKFIFSYDMADKQKVFQQSLKQIQDKNAKKASQSQKNMTQSKGKGKGKRESGKLQINLIPSRQQNFQQAINKSLVTGIQRQQLLTMKFVGGYTRSRQILDKYKTQTMSSFRAQLKVSQMQYESNRIDFGIGIKTKRLIDSQIKQMRQQQSQVQFKKNAQQDEKDQQSLQVHNEVKPNQLSTILSKQFKHRQIWYLKILTIFVLVGCSAASIAQYQIVKQQQNVWFEQLTNLRILNEMKTSVLSINLFVNYLCNYVGKDLLTYELFHDSINQLDRYLDYYQFGVNAGLIYADGSSDQYYLGFALNKLVSQANSLQLNQNKLFNFNDTNTFFVRYNTINGISVSLLNQNLLLWNKLESILNNIKHIYVIFVIAIAVFVFVIAVIKNILMKMTMRKKQQILQIFFEIPRVSCGAIQKQCEKFILMLSLQNQQEQFQLTSAHDEMEDAGKKGKKIQKKRTIMGQQNTTLVYMIVSVFLIALLIIFQVYSLTFGTTHQQNMKSLSKIGQDFYNLQYQLFGTAVYLQSFSYDQSLPINNTFQHLSVIDQTLQYSISGIKNIRKSYFKLKSILDQQFNKQATRLFYQSVCQQNQVCDSKTTQVQQQNYGLNSVITKFLQVVKIRYTKTIKSIASTEKPPQIAGQDFLIQKMYQYSMKQHWRKITKLIQQSFQKYMNAYQVWNVWVLVIVCVLNLAIIMFVSLKYYMNLQQKIKATQYILTFIPIDEINKNKNIAQYIKQQIINRR